MRSIGFTVVLTLAAALAISLAGWQLRQGNFDALLGAPPRAPGDHLYDSFSAADVRHIRIAVGGATADFSMTSQGWQASVPWEDRMDPRAALGIIAFTLGMRVEDVAAMDEVDEVKTGLGENAIQIRLEDAGRRPLARYHLGRVTPWKTEIEDYDEPVLTVFVNQRDRHRKRHAYVCTGDITPLFRDGLKFLRDHRPFYFNPANLEKIRIRSQQGELTLGRAAPGEPWRITKPLDLPTDPVAMRNLLEGLYEFRAIRVSDRAEAMPAGDGVVKPMQIAITSFGDEQETVLEISPLASAEARETGATVSDRPNAWFELPVKPESGVVSLADLPLSMNELRDPVLTRLNPASLRRISIVPATGAAISLEREPPGPWMTMIHGVRREANEENLFSLLTTVTSARAIAFESDAATDFSQWGLDRPILILRFLAANNQGVELRFGLDMYGGLFVNRTGTTTVMRMDESLLAGIAIKPFEWRHARLWSIDRVNLSGIERQIGNESPLLLRYRFIDESWQATVDGEDRGADLEAARANHMLSVLEGLRVARWLDADDAQAAIVLAQPSLVFRIVEKRIDDDGNLAGLEQRTLELAPGTGETAGFFIGRSEGELHPFLIDAGTYARLALDLFGN